MALKKYMRAPFLQSEMEKKTIISPEDRKLKAELAKGPHYTLVLQIESYSLFHIALLMDINVPAAAAAERSLGKLSIDDICRLRHLSILEAQTLAGDRASSIGDSDAIRSYTASALQSQLISTKIPGQPSTSLFILENAVNYLFYLVLLMRAAPTLSSIQLERLRDLSAISVIDPPDYVADDDIKMYLDAFYLALRKRKSDRLRVAFLEQHLKIPFDLEAHRVAWDSLHYLPTDDKHLSLHK